MGIIEVKPLTSLARGEAVPSDRSGGLLMVEVPEYSGEDLADVMTPGTYLGGRVYATETACCFYCTESLTGATKVVYWAGIPSDPASAEGTLHIMLHPGCARRLAARLLRDAEDAEDAAR